MTQRRPIQTLGLSTVAILAIMLATTPQWAVGQKAANKAPTKAKASAKAKAKAPRGRLPAFYGQVVDESQREKIYSIQKEYRPKIDDLKAQLALLLKQRNEEIAAVLTPEQQKKLEQVQREAKKGHKAPKKPAAKKKRAAKKKPASKESRQSR